MWDKLGLQNVVVWKNGVTGTGMSDSGTGITPSFFTSQLVPVGATGLVHSLCIRPFRYRYATLRYRYHMFSFPMSASYRYALTGPVSFPLCSLFRYRY